MTGVDRTLEFNQAVQSHFVRAHRNPGDARRALSHHPYVPLRTSDGSPRTSVDGPSRQNPKSDFAHKAAQIGREIASTSEKLQKLAQRTQTLSEYTFANSIVAKRKTLFDDKPIEISELTYIIKQDIAGINRSISDLQQFQKAHKARRKTQIEEHSENVIIMLQSKLANTSIGFKDVLEIRTQNMKASKSRSEQFLGIASASSTPPLPSSSQHQNGASSSALYRPSSAQASRSRQQSDMFDLSSEPNNPYALTTPNSQQHQQQLLIDQQDTYLDSRSSAIASIESTIAELGGIFTQLAEMVSEQRETVQRIDAHTDDIVTNIGGAQRELLKYYARVSSNRWLMMKVFFLITVLLSLCSNTTLSLDLCCNDLLFHTMGRGDVNKEVFFSFSYK